ncbi:hypothetical protein ACXIUA_00015 [Corynebacterium sp. UMB8791]
MAVPIGAMKRRIIGKPSNEHAQAAGSYITAEPIRDRVPAVFSA